MVLPHKMAIVLRPKICDVISPYVYAMPCVCLSVRSSVTTRCSVNTAKHITMQITTHEVPATLVSASKNRDEVPIGSFSMAMTNTAKPKSRSVPARPRLKPGPAGLMFSSLFSTAILSILYSFSVTLQVTVRVRIFGYITKHQYNCNILYYVRTSNTLTASCIRFRGLDSNEANGRRHLQTMQNIDIGLAPLVNCPVCLVTDGTKPELWPSPAKASKAAF